MPRDAFNIVFIQPSGFPHGGVYLDLARLLQFSLESLGHEVEVNFNLFSPNRINIVLGYHMLANVELLRGLRWIPYQLEQLDVHNDTHTRYWLKILAEAKEIWDFDPGNIAYLRSRGIEAVSHVPIGFHPSMRTIVPVEPEIDVLHYGSVSDRREPIFASLLKRCDFKAVFGTYGAYRDDLISRSKIVLNLHQFDDGAPFEQVRVSFLLNNAVCVVCEDANYNPYAEILPTVAYDRLVDRCLELLADESGRRQMADDAGRRFSQMPMTEILSAELHH
jgi:hypothetical protein